MANYTHQRIYNKKTGNAGLVKLTKSGKLPKKYKEKKYSKGAKETRSGAKKQKDRGW